jgi:hypothetical protein
VGDASDVLNAGAVDLQDARYDRDKPPRQGSKQRTRFDARQALAEWAGVDPT